MLVFWHSLLSGPMLSWEVMEVLMTQQGYLLHLLV